MATPARLAAHPLVPEIAAGVVAARKTMSVAPSSPNNSLASRSGVLLVTKARRWAAAARYRYVAGRLRMTLTFSAAIAAPDGEGRPAGGRGRAQSSSAQQCTEISPRSALPVGDLPATGAAA